MLEKLSRSFHKTLYLAKEHSPEILAAVSSVASVGAVIFAVKSGTKAGEVLEEHQKKLDEVHTVVKAAEEAEDQTEWDYSSDDEKKDLAKIYVSTGLKMAKTYAPTIILESIALACNFGGAYTSRKKINSLIATATVMQGMHEAYRQNVIERFGKDVDEELRYGLKTKVKDYISGDGQEVKSENIKIMDKKPDDKQDISRIFDETSEFYIRDAYSNRQFIKSIEQWANRELRKRGFLFLNDVYVKLGFAPTEYGHDAGWVYKDKTTDDVRKHHNYVEIKMIDVFGNPAKEFEMGVEPSVILDFNIDGVIKDEINWEKKKKKEKKK